MPGSARATLLPLAAAALLVATPNTKSDPVGIYAIVDKVTILPDTTNPKTIQVWGEFSVSAQQPGDVYKPATRGYLYFAMDPTHEREVRAEWADLRSVAGKGQIVGFSSRYTMSRTLRVRCPTEAPASPDPYTTNIGVSYAPSAGIVSGVKDPPNMSAGSIDKDLKSGKASAAPCPK